LLLRVIAASKVSFEKSNNAAVHRLVRLKKMQDLHRGGSRRVAKPKNFSTGFCAALISCS
jgi:hypothetical protein